MRSAGAGLAFVLSALALGAGVALAEPRTAGAQAPSPERAPEPTVTLVLESDDALVLGVNVQEPPRLDLVDGLGIGWIRMNLPWAEVEPAPDVWRFDAVDARLAEARARGLSVLAILSRTPEWAGGGPLGTRPPEDFDAWERYVATVASRYAGEIAAYEVGNEPDLEGGEVPDVGLDRGFWNRLLGRTPSYPALLERAARAIRAAPGAARVVAPALSSSPNRRSRWLLRQIEAEGLGREIDAVSVHANTVGDDDSASPEAVAARLRRQLARIARHAPSLAAQPVWITEVGVSVAAVGEAGQAWHLCRLLDQLALAEPVTHVFLYKIADTPDERRGLFTTDGEPRMVVEIFDGEGARPGRWRPGQWDCPAQSL